MIPEDRRQGAGRILINENHRTIPNSRTSYYQRSFIPDTSRHWNQLPHEVRSCRESKKFKQHIKLLHSTPQPPHYFTLGTKVGNMYTTHANQTGDVKAKHTPVLHTKNSQSFLRLRLQTRKLKTFHSTLPKVRISKI